ncbi:hypothetical protein CHS0354_006051 [Potamilus streckersoni]|uniref:Ion transport domain-containing protein n=1 Tax=Potamilus streckersoni TaxID=2493646 RepID=A0AAE0S3Y2_9BIVA|nr:hypothetical protein CHS0354_006051 [Potamilus streckersoni]
MVVLTCISFILSTHPLFREQYDAEPYTIENKTTMMDRDELMMIRYKNPKIALVYGTKKHKVLSYFEDVAMFYFTVDFVCQMISCPKRIRFICDFHNVVDIMVVSSMLIVMIYEKILFISAVIGDEDIRLYDLCKAAVILRLLRLLRFSKHFKGLQNIPLALWWSIITKTTVGYGDFYPTTLPGYIVGVICAVSGLLLAMPIAIITTNFTQYYTESKLYLQHEQLTKGSSDKRHLYKLCCRNRVHSAKT